MTTTSEIDRLERDLTLAVKERVEHQLRVLDIEITPSQEPNADQQKRRDLLQFELVQLNEAFDEAERQVLGRTLDTDRTETSGEES